MLKAFVYDQTGKDLEVIRRPILVAALERLGVEVGEWSGSSIEIASGGEILVLAHVTDLSNSQEAALQTVAENGAVVIRYSAGSVENTARSCGAGWALSMAWHVLKQMLEQMHINPNLSAFLLSIERFQRSNVLNALAILTWCVTFQAGQRAVTRSQEAWKEDTSKWLGVLGDLTKEELAKACGVDPKSTFPPELAHVERVLLWLWPNGNSGNASAAPDFAAALKELEGHLDIKV